MIWFDDLILYLIPFLDHNIVNLFLTCKLFTKFYHQLNELLLNSAILREAHLIDQNLKPGSRVYSNKNYKIIVIKEILAAVEVDNYGRRVNRNVYLVSKICKDYTIDGLILNPGFKLNNYGPLIESSDSYYFKYKYDANNVGFRTPEINMLVIVRLYSGLHEYVITELTESNGIMEIFENSKSKNLSKCAELITKPKLTLFKINHHWHTEKGFEIVRFGGFL